MTLKSLAEMAATILDEEPDTKATVVSILAEFFQDSLKDDPLGVGDWLAQNGTSVDLFVEMVALLRIPQDASHE